MKEAVHSGIIIWLNGDFLPISAAGISPLDRGFLYGDGFFETIRAEEGKALYLQQHLERLQASLSDFRIALDPVPDWKEITGELLRENGLDRGTARVKIVVTRGVVSGLGLPAPLNPTVCIFAQTYEPPSEEEYKRGWDIHIFDGFSPPLAAHKSLNYVYYLTARQAALDAGCHEAALVDRGAVAETSAGSLLARTGGLWWTPSSAHQLPGITIREACAILLENGVLVDNRRALTGDLLSAETVWVLNSLIGVMPVAHIDGRRVADLASAEAALVRGLLFRRGVSE